MSIIIIQRVEPFAHVYPLPLTALGTRNDLPFEPTKVAAYARCGVTVVAQVTKIDSTLNGLDLTFEIIEGDCETGKALCDGNGIVLDLDLSDASNPDAENLLALVLACGVSLSRIRAMEEIMYRPFLMSVAVPCVQ